MYFRCPEFWMTFELKEMTAHKKISDAIGKQGPGASKNTPKVRKEVILLFLIEKIYSLY